MADDSWRTPTFRQSVVSKIDEAIRQSRMPTSRNSMEMENHVFQKAKSKEEYLGFVARLILHVREMNATSSLPFIDMMNFLEHLFKPRETYTASAKRNYFLLSNSQTSDRKDNHNEDAANDTTEQSQAEAFDIVSENHEMQNEEYVRPVELGQQQVVKKITGKSYVKVANELVEVAQEIISHIKPISADSTKSTTDNMFGEYMAHRLQELDPNIRSMKRRKIVEILEEVNVKKEN